MPANKNALLRYKVLDDCLKRRGRYWPVEDLIEKVATALREDGGSTSVSKRTILEDIKNLRTTYQAPIEIEVGRGYYYADPDFSIANTPLTRDDLPVLHQTLAVLRQLQGLGLSEELTEVVQRVEQRLARPDVAALPTIISFEQVPAYVGTTWLRPLYEAIRTQTPLWLTYQPFQSPAARRELVHPHFLKQYNHRWFLLGLNVHEEHATSTYALDRIQGIELASAVYRPTELSPDTYFQHVIGASVPPDGQVEEIRLRFSLSRAPYILTKPLHNTQRTVAETAAGTEISLQLIPTRELTTQLLSYGADVVVLAPESLRSHIHQVLKQGIATYDQGTC